MLTLGFTNHFYTLWSVSSFTRYGAGSVIDGHFTGAAYAVTKYNYIQNLSMNYEAAKEKISLMAGERGWEEDLSLRGEHGWSFEKTVRQYNAMPEWAFTFGKLDGQDIRTSNDVWQLKRAMNEERGGRRRVYARRRLIELGELVRYSWIEQVYDDEASRKAVKDYCGNPDIYNPALDVYSPVLRKYASAKKAAWLQAAKEEKELSGHFFNDGDKVQLRIKRVGGFSFDGRFGTTFIEKYLTEDGKLVKYMGSAPPDISENDFVNVKATAKHSEYKGVSETKLQRIKIVA